MADRLILVINPGSTSTKLALYNNDIQLAKKTISHPKEQLATLFVLDQLDFRTQCVREFLAENNTEVGQLAMICCRGGELAHIEGGSYAVNQHMMDVLRYACHVQHASNIACFIGNELAKGTDVPVMIHDSPCADEFEPEARVMGLADVPTIPGTHVLNTRMACRKVAEKIGKSYEECNFVVAHLGGGVGINAHKQGRIVDSLPSDAGPMSPERSGRISLKFIIDMCFSGKYTRDQLRKRTMGGSGIMDHLGTQDMRKVEDMVNAGDEKAIAVVKGMAYQIAKALGEMAAALYGQVDRIVITGSLAHYGQLVEWISERVRFIAPVEVMAGEFEMEALSSAAVRVLDGEVKLKEFNIPPYNFDTVEAFHEAFPQCKG